MKSAEAFKRTFGGGSIRIDVADGFTFDPNKDASNLAKHGLSLGVTLDSWPPVELQNLSDKSA